MLDMKPVILIKIGGSLITDKKREFWVRKGVLNRICREIGELVEGGHKIVLGHGSGSFGHVPAKKYKMHLGFVSKQSGWGLVKTAAAARELNGIVVEALIKAGVGAVAVSPLSMMTAKNGELKSINVKSVEEILKWDLLPVVYGDVILDSERGCTIFSTEKALRYLGLGLKKRGLVIGKVIHVGRARGFLVKGKVIPEITTNVFGKLKGEVFETNGVDVTGGMMHKVEEALVLAKKGVESLIVGGEKGNLTSAVLGNGFVGTRVKF